MNHLQLNSFYRLLNCEGMISQYVNIKKNLPLECFEFFYLDLFLEWIDSSVVIISDFLNEYMSYLWFPKHCFMI